MRGTSRSATRLALAAVSAGLIVTALTGCSLLGGSAANRGEDGQVVEANEEADAFDIRIGDCLDTAKLSGSVESVPSVPCDEAHDSEAYFTENIDADAFPGATEVDQQAQEVCSGPAFEDYIGTEYDASALGITYLTPTAGSWTSGDREIVCIAIDSAGGLTESLKGSKR